MLTSNGFRFPPVCLQCVMFLVNSSLSATKSPQNILFSDNKTTKVNPDLGGGEAARGKSVLCAAVGTMPVNGGRSRPLGPMDSRRDNASAEEVEGEAGCA